jgi:hypothetical protein
MAREVVLCSGDDALPKYQSDLRAIHTLNTPKNYMHLLGKSSLIEQRCQIGAQGFMWGARGPFLPVAAMVAVVVLDDVGRWRLTSD